MDIRCFKDAKNEYMPSVIWDWCAKPTPEEIDNKLSSFLKMGISRVYIRPSKGLITGYLSEDYFELIRTAARRSEKHGITLWICDENSSCSGSGGGEITSVHDYRMKDIVKTSKEDTLKTDTVICEEEDCLTVLRDMSQVRGSKRLPLPDITDDFVCQCFFEEVYDKYLRSCKRFIGTEICGISTRISLPENAVLYSKKAFDAFTGDKNELISALTQPCASHHKTKYYGEINSLVSSCFTKAALKKCHENNLLLSAVVEGASIISRQDNYCSCDKPSLEVLSEDMKLADIKLLTSACAFSDKEASFRIKAPSFSRAESRFNTALFLSSFGAQEICFESSAFSLSDRRKYEPYTTVFSENAEKEISERISRLCHLSSTTKERADLLVVYPSYAIYASHGHNSSRLLEEFEALVEKLIKNGVAFHLFEESILTKNAKITDGITLGEKSYKKVLLPCTSLFYEDTVSLIKASGVECFVTEKVPSLDLAKIIDDELINSISSLPFVINSSAPLYINRRFDENGEYIFLCPQQGDASISLKKEDGKIFIADFTDGEFYELKLDENGECNFLVESGKTVILLDSENIFADFAPPLAGGIVNTDMKKINSLPFLLTASDENILPLKTVNACFGHKSYRDGNVDELHKAFYSLNDGETVKVKYPFTAKKNGLGDVFIYIENADAMEALSLNGKPLMPLSPSEKDPRFFGVNITDFIADGKNTLALEYKKCNNYTPDYQSRTPSYYAVYSLTSFEPVYLAGDFDCLDGSIFPCNEEYGNDVSVCGMPYYHGPLHYSVKLPEDALSGELLVVEGDFDICTIKVGKRSKTFFSGTPMIELFELDSFSTAEIIIYNTPFNLFRTTPNEPEKFGITDIYMAKLDECE